MGEAEQSILDRALVHAANEVADTVVALASLRDRSRSFLSMGGVSLTISVGLLSASRVGGRSLVVAVLFAAAATVAFLLQAALSFYLNRGITLFLMPHVSELLSEEGGDASVRYAKSAKRMREIRETNWEALQPRTQCLDWQLGLFVLQVLLLALALFSSSFAAATAGR